MIRWEQCSRLPLAFLPWCAVGLAWVAGVLVLRWLGSANGLPFKGCPASDLFGATCPACGSTRAGLALLRGDPAAGFAANPLAAALLLAGAGTVALRLLFGRRPVLRLGTTGWRLAPLILICLVLANWLYVR